MKANVEVITLHNELTDGIDSPRHIANSELSEALSNGFEVMDLIITVLPTDSNNDGCIAWRTVTLQRTTEPHRY